MPYAAEFWGGRVPHGESCDGESCAGHFGKDDERVGACNTNPSNNIYAKVASSMMGACPKEIALICRPDLPASARWEKNCSRFLTVQAAT